MRRPAVFFDRDNTLIIGSDYLGDPAGVNLVAGAPGAVAACRHLGFAVVVVSNQSGVARGMFSEAAVSAVNREMDRQLKAANPAAIIDRHEFCPHHPDGTNAAYAKACECRKPKPGMIYAAAEAMALDLEHSWMIGDAPRDIVAGKTAGCRTILIIDPTLNPSPAASEQTGVEADFTVGSLVEAIEVVAQQANKPATKPFVPTPIAPPPAPPAAVVAAPKAEPPRVAASVTTDAKPASPSAENDGPSKQVADESATPANGPSTPKKPAAPTPPPAAPRLDLSRLEANSQQILMELKKLNEQHDDFSISKLIAGITQTLALAALPVAYVLYRNDANTLQAWLLTAIFLQAFTVALLVMGRQK